MKNKTIRTMSLCVFRHEGRILVFCGYDPVEKEKFYRPLGGGVKFRESSEKAMRREIKEELGASVTGVKLLGILENKFTYRGNPGHEITFIFDGQFKDKSFYKKKHIPALEGGDREIKTKWINPYRKKRKTLLYPEGLAELLKECKEKGI